MAQLYSRRKIAFARASRALARCAVDSGLHASCAGNVTKGGQRAARASDRAFAHAAHCGGRAGASLTLRFRLCLYFPSSILFSSRCVHRASAASLNQAGIVPPPLIIADREDPAAAWLAALQRSCCLPAQARIGQRAAYRRHLPAAITLDISTSGQRSHLRADGGMRGRSINGCRYSGGTGDGRKSAWYHLRRKLSGQAGYYLRRMKCAPSFCGYAYHPSLQKT